MTKAITLKWCFYCGIFLLFLLFQNTVLDPLSRIIGTAPFLAPAAIAVAAQWEGTKKGGAFAIVAGALCDMGGSGIFPGVYTLTFFLAAYSVGFVARSWVMRSAFGALLCAILSFFIIDLVHLTYLFFLRAADPLLIAKTAGLEAALSLPFTIPIFFIYRKTHLFFRYD